MKLGPVILFEKFVITDPAGDPYLLRWRIVDSHWFGVYLHKIIRSDSDRHFHDHSFDFVSIMLRGNYLEFLRGRGVKFREAPSIAFRRAEQAHRLEILSRPAWTLVFRGPRRRPWGFWADGGWVQSDEYLQTTAEAVSDQVVVR